jgi:hypothetical protein
MRASRLLTKQLLCLLSYLGTWCVRQESNLRRSG